MHTERSGFTLIELMVVVAVIAIIAAMAFPSLLNARKSAIEAKVISIARSIVTSQEMYRTRFGTYATDIEYLGSSGILPAMEPGSDFFPEYDSVAYGANASGWFLAVDPVDPGVTADRYFYVDVTGVIRVSSSGTASSASPPLD